MLTTNCDCLLNRRRRRRRGRGPQLQICYMQTDIKIYIQQEYTIF